MTLPSLDPGVFSFSHNRERRKMKGHGWKCFMSQTCSVGVLWDQPTFHWLSFHHGETTAEEGLGDEVHLRAQEEIRNDLINEQLVSASFFQAVFGFIPHWLLSSEPKAKVFFSYLGTKRVEMINLSYMQEAVTEFKDFSRSLAPFIQD